LNETQTTQNRDLRSRSGSLTKFAAAMLRRPAATVACLRVGRLVCVSAQLPKNCVGDNAMEILLPLAIYFAIWLLVIWGSTYFNKLVV
jgi:hypothetical protein